MELHFILVKPAVPEHVGSIARALKTMGFQSLRIVGSDIHKDEKARWLAHGSTEILDNVIMMAGMEQVVEEFDLVIGTTSKSRKVHHDYYSCESISALLTGKEKSVSKVAIVFGSEKHGLDNAVLKQCDIITYIPMKSDYPSLNLSQAVMVYAYILSSVSNQKEKELVQNEIQSYRILKEKLELLLDMIGVKGNMNLYNRINERLAVLKDDDIHLIHSVCNSLLDKISDQST